MVLLYYLVLLYQICDVLVGMIILIYCSIESDYINEMWYNAWWGNAFESTRIKCNINKYNVVGHLMLWDLDALNCDDCESI